MDGAVLLSLAGIILGAILLIVGTYQGYTPIAVTLLSTLVVAVTSHIPIGTAYTEVYAGGVADMIRTILLVICGACMLSDLYEKSGSIDLLSRLVEKYFGAKNAVAATILGASLFSFGGLGFGGILIIYRIALQLFQKAGFSRFFIPSCITLGALTYSIMGPFAVDTLNYLPTQYYGTPTSAGLFPGLLGSAAILVCGLFFLTRYIPRKAQKGERWAEKEQPGIENAPSLRLSSCCFALLPILVVFFTYNILRFPIAISTFLGSVSIVLTHPSKFSLQKWIQTFCDGAVRSVAPSFNMAAFAGYAAVVVSTPAYQQTISLLEATDQSPYLMAVLIPAVIAAMLGSGTNAMVIGLAETSTYFLSYQSLGVDMGVIHRLNSMTAGVFDALPSNGTINSLMQMWSCPYTKGYLPIFICTCLFPAIATAGCCLLVCCLGG